MKLRLGLLLIFTCAYFFSRAQKMQYGLTTAINLSDVSGTGMSSKFQTGVEAGGFAKIPLTKQLSLQPEVL